ncbi:DUF460 domain-containing protein [Pyrodictium abyssi]|uniref:DUF460 domain-containing protein n=1 Tax=Pyrodictium abyssi TaxID=54256 RepID=A0ABN6ZSA8_9CREN|nr:DUF460 domain-containing protein [Pyrodictium abyssi]
MSLRAIGIDVEPGCSSGARCYSVAVVEDGKLVAKYESVPLHRLIRLVWEYRPDILAVDNIYELASTEKELVKITSMLPPDLNIVQPTRLPDGSLVNLRKLARLAGLDVGGSGKLSPARTAYLAAMLASMGYGSRVRFVEEKTRIVVAKSRRLKHGGMSSPRYQRRVRSAILRAVKDIKRLLDRHRLDYDLLFRKSGGGLDSAVFVVYAPRSRLTGVIKPHEDNDVRIEIQPVYSSRIVFENTVSEQLDQTKPYIIVGIDPGISTGVAAVDLNGRPVFALSRRGMDRSEVIELITRYGIPVMVATDVRPAPEFVRKLAAAIGVPIYEPPVSLSVEEKRSIVEEYTKRFPELRKVADAHVRDALAAAIKALHIHESKMRQVESYTARLGIDIDVDAIKADVIRGATIAEAVERAIHAALNDIGTRSYLVKSVRRNKTESEATQQVDAADNAARLRMELEKLRAENMALRKRLRELNEQLQRLEAEYRLLQTEYRESLEKDREVNRLSNEVRLLRAEIEKLRSEAGALNAEISGLREALFLVASGRAIPALRLRELDNESVEALASLARSYGRIVAVMDAINPVQWSQHGSSVSKLLLAVLVPGEALNRRDVIEAHGVPVLPLESYEVKRLNWLVLLDERIIVDAYYRLREIEEAKKRARKRELALADVKRMFEEYRAKRMKLLLEDTDLAFNE